MENVIFLMKTVNITQRENGTYSHRNLQAWDIAGAGSGIEQAFAPCTVKLLAKLPYETSGFSNTVFFGSCDSEGKPQKVRLANKSDRVLTFSLTHMNDISSLTEGKIFKSGEAIYSEGTKGNATGNHIHAEVAQGWQTKKIKRSDGVWETNNIIPINGVFYYLDGWNETKNLRGVSLPVIGARQSLFSVADAQKAFDFVAKKGTLTDAEQKLYDLDSDGKVTLSDAMQIFRQANGK